MSNRRIRKTYTISQDNIAVLDELCKRYNISESEAVNQILAKFAAEEKARKKANGMLDRPQNEGGIFQTKKELLVSQPPVPQDTVPNIDEPAPILRDVRFTYDDILEIKLQLHKILNTASVTKNIVSGIDDKSEIVLNTDNSFLHYLNPNTEYFSADKQPHRYITEAKAEVAEKKRKAQINAATNK